MRLWIEGLREESAKTGALTSGIPNACAGHSGLSRAHESSIPCLSVSSASCSKVESKRKVGFPELQRVCSPSCFSVRCFDERFRGRDVLLWPIPHGIPAQPAAHCAPAYTKKKKTKIFSIWIHFRLSEVHEHDYLTYMHALSALSLPTVGSIMMSLISPVILRQMPIARAAGVKCPLPGPRQWAVILRQMLIARAPSYCVKCPLPARQMPIARAPSMGRHTASV